MFMLLLHKAMSFVLLSVSFEELFVAILHLVLSSIFSGTSEGVKPTVFL